MIFYTKHQPTGPPLARAGIIFLTYKVPTRTHITYFSSLGVHFLRAACLCYYLLMILLCISQLHHSRIHLYLCIFMQAYHRLGLCPSRGRLDSLVSSPCTLSVVLLLYFASIFLPGSTYYIIYTFVW
jgi:hypothetical protein